MGRVRLLLLRHGESAWNAVRRWQGIADVELTDRGRQQATSAAALLAGRYDDLGLVTLWASTLRRAAETAEVIGDVLGVDGVRLDSRLVEADAGPWQGLTPTEIDARWPGDRVNGRRPDGFEPRAAVATRAHSVLTDIGNVTRTDQQPIVVTHSGVIRTIVAGAGITDVSIPNLAGWYVDVDGDDVHVIEPYDPGDIDIDRRSASAILG